MSRPRLATAAATIATALVLTPILATVTIAADEVIVRPGDTLTAIARRHDLTIARLVKLNEIRDPNRIYAGQRLRLEKAGRASPKAVSPAQSAAGARTHTVRAGEHLTGIARHYGQTIAAIATANGIADPSRIYAGQRLTIPGGPGPKAVPARSSAMPASMAAMVAERDAVRRLIVREANRFGVPPAFALAVAWQESGWRQNVVSWAGAVGVMQLLPATGEWVGNAMLGTAVDIHDLSHNVRAGVRLLAHYLHRYDGNRDLVLAAYYQGQTATDRHGVYPVSRAYIASIKALEALFGG